MAAVRYSDNEARDDKQSAQGLEQLVKYMAHVVQFRGSTRLRILTCVLDQTTRYVRIERNTSTPVENERNQRRPV